ncbi:MAG TPA: DUF721 domain-containing protein [Planctomycetota bacterium]|jgi:hypothetical protein
MTERTDGPQPLGDILKQFVRNKGLKKQVSKRAKAQKALQEYLGPELAPHAQVLSVKVGVITIEADASALFQELEGFHKEKLLTAFRNAGFEANEVRVKLSP